MSYVVQELCHEIGQLKQALAEKDRLIECLSEQVNILNQKCCAMEEKYQQLMARAVELARLAMSFSIDEYPYMVKQAIAFLDSPEAQAFLKDHQ